MSILMFLMKKAVTGFTPSGTPAGHWSADTITGLEDGDSLGTWPDQSVNGNDLVQATAAQRPTYQTNEQNSLPIVRCTGPTGWMYDTTLALSQSVTIFIALKITVWTAWHRLFSGIGGNSWMACYQSGITPNLIMVPGSIANNALALNSFGIIDLTYKGANSIFRINSGNETTGTATMDNNPTGFNLANRWDGDGEGASFDVGEIVLYNSEEAYTDNESGLSGKWIA